MNQLLLDDSMLKFIAAETVKPMVSGYLRGRCVCPFTGKNKYALLHHVVWEYSYGIRKQGCHIHHIDGNRLNNTLSNLEILPASEHMRLSNLGLKKPNSGKGKKTAEHRANLSKAHLGKVFTKEHRENLSKALKARAKGTRKE